MTLIALVTLGKSLRGYGLGLFIESMQIMMFVGSMLAGALLVKSLSYHTISPKWLRSTKAKVLVFFGLLFFGVTMAFPLITARLVGPEDLGRMTIIRSYVDFFSPIIATLLLVVIIFRLAITSNKRAASLST